MATMFTKRLEHLTKNVFVAGRAPDITYNPRNDRQLEAEVRSYLDQSGKALSVSGPTKSGKTVLIARLLPRDSAIWMYGSDLTSAEAFWEKIVDWLGLYDALEITDQTAGQVGGTVSGSLGVPSVASVGISAAAQDTRMSAVKRSRKRAMADVAREGLETVAVPIVIDDFHYVPTEVRRDIARAIKSIIPITHVVMIAVPHEAFEAVRREPDMTGRVWNLQIEHWTLDELLHIARSGAEALNLTGADDWGGVLARASYGAPFLMQQLCCDLAVSNSVLKTEHKPRTLDVPNGEWTEFFRRIARRSPPDVFAKLLEGPKVRGQERMVRIFDDGVSVDIYGAVLRAIAITGPKTTMKYQELMKILESRLRIGTIPQPQQVTNTLWHMSSIAEEAREMGDPALSYKNDQLHVLDPFLAFYLRWADWIGKEVTSAGG